MSLELVSECQQSFLFHICFFPSPLSSTGACSRWAKMASRGSCCRTDTMSFSCRYSHAWDGSSSWGSARIWNEKWLERKMSIPTETSHWHTYRELNDMNEKNYHPHWYAIHIDTHITLTDRELNNMNIPTDTSHIPIGTSHWQMYRELNEMHKKHEHPHWHITLTDIQGVKRYERKNEHPQWYIPHMSQTYRELYEWKKLSSPLIHHTDRCTGS